MTARAEPRAQVAVLSAAGPGAIAIVRVWGPSALAVASAAFRPAQGRSLAETPPGRIRFGHMGAGLGDEVVACVLAGDPPQVEVQGHAGLAAIELVLDALRAAGAEVVSADKWVASRGLARVTAEAQLDLARATTFRTAAILLDQAQGSLEAAIRDARDAIPESPERARSSLEALLARAAVGLRLLSGWSVVLAGRPNAGKSRLLNALAGFERAIVHEAPGTTRDVVTHHTALDGWPIELADTAGLRDALDPIEELGIARARERHRSADLVVLLLDISGPLDQPQQAMIEAHPDALRVASKADLPAAWDASGVEAFPVSAVTGQGLDALCQAISARLAPNPFSAGGPVPFRAAQVHLIEQALRFLSQRRPEAAADCLDHLLAPGPD